MQYIYMHYNYSIEIPPANRRKPRVFTAAMAVFAGLRFSVEQIC